MGISREAVVAALKVILGFCIFARTVSFLNLQCVYWHCSVEHRRANLW